MVVSQRTAVIDNTDYNFSGSGKTAAFLVPVLSQIYARGPKNMQVTILC